jgi:hypothetical protein
MPRRRPPRSCSQAAEDPTTVGGHRVLSPGAGAEPEHAAAHINLGTLYYNQQTTPSGAALPGGGRRLALCPGLLDLGNADETGRLPRRSAPIARPPPRPPTPTRTQPGPGLRKMARSARRWSTGAYAAGHARSLGGTPIIDPEHPGWRPAAGGLRKARLSPFTVLQSDFSTGSPEFHNE